MTRSKQHVRPPMRPSRAERNTWLCVEGRLRTNHPAAALRLFILIVLGSVFPDSAATAAGMLRCGSFLIREGDDASTVLAKCGEPTQRTTLTAPVYASSADGATFPTGQVAYTQVWRYDRGSTSFPVILKIVDGVVRSIHFVR